MSKDYVVICKCGGLLLWVAEEHAQYAGKSMTTLIEKGYSLERMGTAEVRQLDMCRNQGKCKESPLFAAQKQACVLEGAKHKSGRPEIGA